jgi:hypothetical protein
MVEYRTRDYPTTTIKTVVTDYIGGRQLTQGHIVWTSRSIAYTSHCRNPATNHGESKSLAGSIGLDLRGQYMYPRTALRVGGRRMFQCSMNRRNWVERQGIEMETERV